MSEPEHDERARRAYASATDEDRARSDKSVAELVEEDKADPDTPDGFDVPLTPYQPPEEDGDGRDDDRPRGDGTLRVGGSDHLMRGDDR